MGLTVDTTLVHAIPLVTTTSLILLPFSKVDIESLFTKTVRMSNQKPISYTIKRVGKNTSEDVQADSFIKAGDTPLYHFFLNGIEVEKIFVHALEKEPIPNYSRTAEEREAWRKLAANSTVTPRRLRR